MGIVVAAASANVRVASTPTAQWSGYAVTNPSGGSTGFTSVTATWKQPRAFCHAGAASSAFWVGLGGFSSNSNRIEQIGAAADCTKAEQAELLRLVRPAAERRRDPEVEGSPGRRDDRLRAHEHYADPGLVADRRRDDRLCLCDEPARRLAGRDLGRMDHRGAEQLQRVRHLPEHLRWRISARSTFTKVGASRTAIRARSATRTGRTRRSSSSRARSRPVLPRGCRRAGDDLHGRRNPDWAHLVGRAHSASPGRPTSRVTQPGDVAHKPERLRRRASPPVRWRAWTTSSSSRSRRDRATSTSSTSRLGAIVLDRRLFTSMSYPADYGFVEDTLAEDGDPLDALVLVGEPTFPGCRIRVRVIGVFHMEDEKGPDDKVICVPLSDPAWSRARRHPRRPLGAAQRDRALLPGLQGPRRRRGHDPRLRQPGCRPGRDRRRPRARRNRRALGPQASGAAFTCALRPANVRLFVVQVASKLEFAEVVGGRARASRRGSGLVWPCWLRRSASAAASAQATSTPTTPSVSTGAATPLTTKTATITGTLTSDGAPTTYSFEYGTTTSYGSQTGTRNAGAGATNVSISVNLYGLSPGTPTTTRSSRRIAWARQPVATRPSRRCPRRPRPFQRERRRM